MLDLFDRRFAVVEDIKLQCIAHFGEDEELAKLFSLEKFSKARDKTRFLFGEEIFEKASEVHDAIRRARKLDRKWHRSLEKSDSSSQDETALRETISAELFKENEKIEALLDNIDILVLPYMLMSQRHGRGLFLS